MPLDDTNWSAPSIEVDETTALLIRARSFLERGWCRGASARDEAEVGTGPTSERAVAWCAVGALIAAGSRNHDQKLPAFRRLEAAIGGDSIVDFNNRQEMVEPVLAAFDRAIAVGHADRDRSAPVEGRAIAAGS